MTIATTHHGMLKAYAHETPHVSNASMEFDQATLKPTYRFRFGVPGSSYALELAKRLDLPASVVSRARDLVGDEKIKLENLLTELERQTQEYRSQIQDVSAERDRLTSLVQAYEQKTKDLREELKVIRKQAVEEAKDIVQGAQALIERSVKDIRESSAEKSTVQSARQNIQDFRKKIQEMTITEERTPPPVLVVGDTVRVKDSLQEGELVELKPPSATVLFGDARLKLRLDTLVKVKGRKGPSGETSASPLFTPEGKTEIDLRGLLGDEAIPQVERFLDDALVAGLHRVDIIHGKGTGALRKRIGEFLKTYPHVKSFRLGEWNEGGAGVTVVELD
jgi:DNA mismatch repair protein MutS2